LRPTVSYQVVLFKAQACSVIHRLRSMPGQAAYRRMALGACASGNVHLPVISKADRRSFTMMRSGELVVVGAPFKAARTALWENRAASGIASACCARPHPGATLPNLRCQTSLARAVSLSASLAFSSSRPRRCTPWLCSSARCGCCRSGRRGGAPAIRQSVPATASCSSRGSRAGPRRRRPPRHNGPACAQFEPAVLAHRQIAQGAAFQAQRRLSHEITASRPGHRQRRLLTAFSFAHCRSVAGGTGGSSRTPRAARTLFSISRARAGRSFRNCGRCPCPGRCVRRCSCTTNPTSRRSCCPRPGR
jgi:hypothetical protein